MPVIYDELFHVRIEFVILWSCELVLADDDVLFTVTPHVPLFFWPSRHNFEDIMLKFCILS